MGAIYRNSRQYSGTQTNAAGVKFDPTGTQFSGNNVQSVIQEADQLMKDLQEKPHITSWNDLEDRPFYTEENRVLQTDETVECTTAGGNGGYVPELSKSIAGNLIAGKTYFVEYDGQNYTCVAHMLGINNYGTLGNEALYLTSRTDTGEPFFITLLSPYVIANSAGTHNIKIYEMLDVHHKLDEKYMPEHTHDHSHSWDELRDKPFNETTFDYKWDGNIEGLYCANETGYAQYYKISDDVLTPEQCIGATFVEYVEFEGTQPSISTYEYTVGNIVDSAYDYGIIQYDGGFVVNSNDASHIAGTKKIYIITAENTEIDGVVFNEIGVYLVRYYGLFGTTPVLVYIESFTDGKEIPESVIPSSIARVQNGGRGFHVFSHMGPSAFTLDGVSYPCTPPANEVHEYGQISKFENIGDVIDLFTEEVLANLYMEDGSLSRCTSFFKDDNNVDFTFCSSSAPFLSFHRYEFSR